MHIALEKLKVLKTQKVYFVAYKGMFRVVSQLGGEKKFF